jgi:ABC-2 type transport system ATP-binding protein
VNAIEVRGLRKAYGATEAVCGIDLDVARGEVFALLGPNGAGKTTTLEILEGFRQRTAGEVRVLDVDPATAGGTLRERIGVVLQETAVEPYLTVREVLTRHAGYYPRPRDVDEVIDLVGLGEKRDARVKSLSGGQQRRLDVGLGIVGGPDLVFLDEPTTGFDPSARRGAWELVRRLTGGGTTIVLTTHYMDEAQALADRIAVIAAGRIVADGTPASIGGRDTAAVRVRFALPPDASPPLPLKVQPDGTYVVETADEVRLLHLLTGWSLESGVPLHGLTIERPTLEDVYLALTTTQPVST